MSGLSDSGNASQGQSSRNANDSSASTSTSVDASDRSTTNNVSRYDNHTLFIPTVTQPTLPATVAAANVSVQAGACGPRQVVTHRPVEGTFIGLFKSRRIAQGVTDSLEQAPDPFRYITLPDGSRRMYGHRVITYTTVVGVSGSRNVQLGGGGSSGNWGQGGYGTSSAMQQLVVRHTLEECEVGTVQPEVQYVEVPRAKGNG